MKINWKIRAKNPVFWLTVIPAIVATVYTILGAFDVVPSVSEEQIVGWVGAIVTALSTLGVLVDPTTEGLGDSDRAMSYDVPAEKNNLEV